MNPTAPEAWFRELVNLLRTTALNIDDQGLWALRLYTLRIMLDNQNLFLDQGLALPETPPILGREFESISRIADAWKRSSPSLQAFFWSDQTITARDLKWDQIGWHWHSTKMPFRTLNDLEQQGHAIFALAAERYVHWGRLAVTQPQSATLVAELVARDAPNQIYDPACGIGNQLIACAQISRAAGVTQPMLYGQDIVASLLEWSTLHCLMLGFTEFQFAAADALTNPQFKSHDRLMRFPAVITDPPFGLKQWHGREQWQHNPYNRPWSESPLSSIEWAFVQHGFASLQPGGRFAILMNAGTLIRGREEREARAHLVHQDWLEAVIAIPPGMWSPAHKLGGFILVITQQKRPALSGRVLMVDVSDMTEPKRFRQNGDRPAFITAALNAFWSLELDPRHARIVDNSEIQTQNFNLQPTAYLESTSAIPAVDLMALRQEAGSLEAASQRTRQDFNDALDALRQWATRTEK